MRVKSISCLSFPKTGFPSQKFQENCEMTSNTTQNPIYSQKDHENLAGKIVSPLGLSAKLYDCAWAKAHGFGGCFACHPGFSNPLWMEVSQNICKLARFGGLYPWIFSETSQGLAHQQPCWARNCTVSSLIHAFRVFKHQINLDSHVWWSHLSHRKHLISERRIHACSSTTPGTAQP